MGRLGVLQSMMRKIFISVVLLTGFLPIQLKAQVSVSLSSGIMEHKVIVPWSWHDQFYSLTPRLELFYTFQKPQLEVGLSYTYYKGRIETYDAWKYPNQYRYYFGVERPFNLMAYCGAHSDQNRLIQTYAGLKVGYWAHNFWYWIENQTDWTDQERGEGRLNHFALGPRFGMSVGRRVQFILESEHFWLTPSNYAVKYFKRVSTIQVGIRYNFKRMESENSFETR